MKNKKVQCQYESRMQIQIQTTLKTELFEKKPPAF